MTKEQSITDYQHIYNFVRSLLEEWQKSNSGENDGGKSGASLKEHAQTGLVLIHMPEALRCSELRKLEPHRKQRVSTLIHDMLTSPGLVAEFGNWAFVDYDYPYYALLRLPDNGAKILAFGWDYIGSRIETHVTNVRLEDRLPEHEHEACEDVPLTDGQISVLGEIIEVMIALQTIGYDIGHTVPNLYEIVRSDARYSEWLAWDSMAANVQAAICREFAAYVQKSFAWHFSGNTIEGVPTFARSFI